MDNKLVTNSSIRPVWQLPVHGAERTGNSYIPNNAKYHCFVDNKSLCDKYHQDTSYYDDGITVESGAIATSPNIACSRCYKKWKNEYCERSE